MRLLPTLLAVTLLFVALAASCGKPSGGNRPVPQGSEAPLLAGLTLNAGKGVSGLPLGVIVTWPRVSDPKAVGYYLYRDTKSISSADPLLRANSGSIIPQPSNDPVVFYDLFSPAIGQTYYYRLSVVDIFDEESDLSNELSITIQPQNVTGLAPSSGYYGDTITVQGQHFGVYNSASDFVYFVTDGMERLQAAIIDWQDSSIQCVVPEDAITAPVQVEVSGTVSQSDEAFTILNPFLISVTPAYAMPGEQITLSGDNLGNAPSGGDGLTMPGGAFLAYDSPSIASWSNKSITLTVPADLPSSGEITATVNSEVTNGVQFSVKPRIINCDPRRLVPGAATVVTLSGYSFGSGQDGSLHIIDMSASDPVDPVVVPSSHIVYWSNYTVYFRTPVADYGALPALVVMRGVYSSDPYSVAMLPLLACEFLYPVPGVTITQPTTFAVKYATDMEKVEFFLNSEANLIATDDAGPAFEITLDPSTMFNGTYTLIAKAYRGDERATGTIVFDVLSLQGDTNCDGVVDDLDVDKLYERFGVLAGSALYHRYLDPNLDGRINEADVAYIGYYYTGAFGEP